MKSNLPVIRQINWLTLIFQIVILLFLMWWLDVYLGALVYLPVFLGSRQLITSKHRKGFRLMRTGNYDDAIVSFNDSYNFFNEHNILNKYVAKMISASKITYKEMALLNIAYCYLQKKDGAKAKEIYEQTLLEFPDSMIAKNALTTFEAMKNVE